MSAADRVPRRRGISAGAGVLFASGLAALAHQVLWTRRLVDLLGASAETFSMVIGVFFGMMSLGAAWAAWRPAGEGGGWRRVAWAEGLVGATGLIPLLGVEALVGHGVTGLGAGIAGRWGMVLGLIGLPSFAMGWVFPAVRGMYRGAAAAQGLYAWNTVGGLVGALVIAFFVLPWAGIRGAGLIVCATNLLVAGYASRCAAGAGNGRGVDDVPEDTFEPVGTPWTRRRWLPWMIGAGSGFAVIGGEVALQMQFLQVAVNSHLSSVVVLGFVLAGLSLGAFAAWRWPMGRGGLICAGLACLAEPAIFGAMQPGMAIVPYELAPPSYFGRLLMLGAGTAVFVMTAGGWVFPWLLGNARGEREVGVLLAVNGLGGWLGAEAVPGWILPTVGMWGAMAMLGGVYATLACVAGVFGTRGWTSWACLAGGVGLGIASVGVERIRREAPQVRLAAGERLVELAVGREGVVATVTAAADDWRILMNNTYTLGGSRARVNQERQALLPIVLHGAARSVALLGFATGSTTAGAAAAPSVERVDAFELSPLVARMAATHFGPWNREVARDPRVRLVVDDARIGVAGRRDTYDVVVGDLFLPWRTGEGRMYAREHFAAVRRALREGGLFCQWLPLFQLTRAQYETIVRTFASEFRNGFLVRGDFYAELPIVGLVGTREGRHLGEWDWSRVGEACASLRRPDRRVGDPLVRHPEGVAMAVLGPMPDAGPGPVNTLANGWIEWDAGRTIIGLRSPWFVGVPWAEAAREAHRLGIAAMPEASRTAHDAGQFFLTLEVAAVSKSRVFSNLAAQVWERTPEPLRRDGGASWEGWPSRVKIPGR